MQNRRDPAQVPPANVYGLMSHISHIPAAPQQQAQQSQAPPNIQRPNSAQNPVPYGYEPTPSPIQ